MLKQHELPGDPGAQQKKKRVGRGEGSGLGKTSGYGHKGEKARSGRAKGKGFEGGQVPLMRRLPKFGFTNHSFQKKKGEVTIEQLNQFESGATVDAAVLLGARLISKQITSYKVIGNGELSKKLTVKAHGFSAGARATIEGAGGTCETIETKSIQA
jgi:large subunit ribosomal protein L15